MFAVIQTGGKQYKVAEHDVIRVEKLAGEAGETVELGQVLMLGSGADAQIGAPLVEGARVVATILEQAHGPKILVFKKKRRKNYRRTRGHRQDLTVLRVTDILSAGETPKKPAKTAAKSKETAAKAKAAPQKAAPQKAAPKKAEAKKVEPKKAAPKTGEKAPVKAKAAPKKAAPKAKAAPKTDAKATAKAKSAPKKSAATKAPAKTKAAAKPKAKTGKGSGKEKA